MPGIASTRIVVVFEHELALAAKALAPFADKDAKTTGKDVQNALAALKKFYRQIGGSMFV